MKKRAQSSLTDYIVLILFITLTVIMFIWELSSPASENTQREEILFKVFEILFSAAIGWSLQRIQSREDFNKSLKQFAVSAYRRILDIEKAVTRLSSTITTFNEQGDEKSINYKSLLVLTDGIIDTVNSSAADWQDILGEDLEKIELYQSLKKDYALQAIRGSDDAELQKLKDQIEQIRSEIPNQLFDDAKPIYSYGRPEPVVTYIRDAIFDVGGFTILGEISDSVKADKYIEVSKLSIGSPLKLIFTQAMHSSAFLVCLDNEEIIGSLINPFIAFGIHDFEFHNALVYVLQSFFGPMENEKSYSIGLFAGILPNDRNKFKIKIIQQA